MLLTYFRYAGGAPGAPGGMQPPQRKSSQDLTATGGIVGTTGE